MFDAQTDSSCIEHGYAIRRDCLAAAQVSQGAREMRCTIYGMPTLILLLLIGDAYALCSTKSFPWLDAFLKVNTQVIVITRLMPR